MANHMTNQRTQHTRAIHLALAVALLPAALPAMYAQAPKVARVAAASPTASSSTGTSLIGTNDALIRNFQTPPNSAKLRCYWWWLNGHTTKATITRDLTEMQHKGYGGVLLVDANGANQTGNNDVPAGPLFASPAWNELYVHALKTADQLGLEITLNITSGWNLGAPWVKAENASKLLTFSRITLNTKTPDAKAASNTKLPMPPTKGNFYRQIAVLAYPLHQGAELPGKGTARKPLSQLGLKSASAEGSFSMPDLSGILTDTTPGLPDPDADLTEIVDITNQVGPDGTLHWTPPNTSDSKESWEVLRVGYTASGARVSTSSGDWQGLAIDYLDPSALDLYWNTSVLPLIQAAKPYHSLKYIASDSWELGGTNWTIAFREEFRKRRGYDPVPYLPIVSGRILGSRDLSTRFLADLRRTVADLVNDHYDHLAALGKPFGLGIECESGGPHSAPLDGIETFRSAAVVQTEYWAYSAEHRSTDEDRFFVKEASSAAHIYGKTLVAAEGMTSIGNQWNESLGLNLKPSFDRALTEGLNRLVWHEFTSSPPELGLPGQEYFAGTHLNPNVTWWRHAAAFTTYLNRAQFLMQQGQPVSDVLYYYGDMVPNFARLKQDDPAQVLPGYDYDVTSTEALLQRMKITGTTIQTPEGITYKVLALPKYRILPLAALLLADQYMKGGGTLVGLRPIRPQGVVPDSDMKLFATIADQWTACEQAADNHIRIGQGHLFCTLNSREALQAIHVLPDMQPAADATASLDYVHRRIPPSGTQAATDIYFLRNTQPKLLQTTVTLNASGQPELLNAVTGQVIPTLLYGATADNRISLPITLEPYGSIFIILRSNKAAKVVTHLTLDNQTLYDPTTNKLPLELAVTAAGLATPTPGTYDIAYSDGTTKHLIIKPAAPIAAPTDWTLAFPPNWGAPPFVPLTTLTSWSESTDPGVRYFSGTATYRTTLKLTAAQLASATRQVYLSLGEIHEVAAVRINGKPAVTLWKQPWSTRIDTLLHPGSNTIEVDVTNLWPNRLIGDAQDPAAKHFTWTNITYYKKDSALLPSGMLGPVTLQPLYTAPLK